MAARKPWRYLAPLALLATMAAVALLVRGQLQTSSPSSPPPMTGGLSHSFRQAAPAARPKYYRVKHGDTLSGISVKTHVPIYTLEKLNPGLDPNALQTGQRLKLRR